MIWGEAERFRKARQKETEEKARAEMEALRRLNSEQAEKFRKRILGAKASGEMKD